VPPGLMALQEIQRLAEAKLAAELQKCSVVNLAQPDLI